MSFDFFPPVFEFLFFTPKLLSAQLDKGCKSYPKSATSE